MHAFSSVLLFVFESVKEDVFWRNYFYRVSLIKQSAQLTALAAQQQAAGKEEKNHGRQNELPLTGIFKKASLCRANVTNVPLKNTQILMILSLCTCQKCHRYLRENPFPSREDIHSSPVALSLTLPTCLPSVFIYFAFSHSSGFLFLPPSPVIFPSLSLPFSCFLFSADSVPYFPLVLSSIQPAHVPSSLVCRAELGQPAWNQTSVSDTCDSSLLWQFYPGCWGKWFIISAMISKLVCNLFGTRDWFRGRQFFSSTREGMGWFQDVSSALHFLCSLFLIWCCCCSDRRCQSMGQRLGTPDLIPLIIIKICILCPIFNI